MASFARAHPAIASLAWPLAALALLVLFNLVFTPGFFSIELRDGRFFGTPIDILNHASKVAIVAVGMTIVIATGGVDLSVGAVVAIAGAVAATPSPASMFTANAEGVTRSTRDGLNSIV